MINIDSGILGLIYNIKCPYIIFHAILYLNKCILYVESIILYPVCWINHPVSCILNLEFFISCFLIIEPCILYPVCLINHPVSCILNQAFFILYLNSWTLYPVCWIKHSVYPVSKHLVSCIFRGVLEFQRKGGTFEARQRPIKNIVVPPPHPPFKLVYL